MTGKTEEGILGWICYCLWVSDIGVGGGRVWLVKMVIMMEVVVVVVKATRGARGRVDQKSSARRHQTKQLN